MKKIFLVILGISFFGGICNCQNLIRVNNNPGIDADYTNLQDANDNASDGDTIYVEGSETEYPGANISHRVTIIGPGYFLSENLETHASGPEARFNGDINFNNGSAGSLITGCNFGYYYTNINENSISVIRCLVYDIKLTGVIENILVLQNYIRHSIQTTSQTCAITNSLISNNIIEHQIDLDLNSSMQIANNVFVDKGSWSYPIDCYNSTIQNNIITGSHTQIRVNTGNTITNNILASDGINSNGNQYNVVMANVFVDYNATQGYSTDGKWQLKAGSQAIGAGVGGVDCGAYGGVNPYVLSGIPNLPHIYEASIPSTANSNEGLTVTIKVKSGQ